MLKLQSELKNLKIEAEIAKVNAEKDKIIAETNEIKCAFSGSFDRILSNKENR